MGLSEDVIRMLKKKEEALKETEEFKTATSTVMGPALGGSRVLADGPEFITAVRILRKILAPALKANPELDLCRIKRICEALVEVK